jgi:hypothetical protein
MHCAAANATRDEVNTEWDWEERSGIRIGKRERACKNEDILDLSLFCCDKLASVPVPVLTWTR